MDIYTRVVMWIVTSLCIIAEITIAVYHAIIILKKAPLSWKHFRKQRSLYFSCLLILLGLMFVFYSIWLNTRSANRSILDCILMKDITAALYSLFKVSMYIVLMLRLWESYVHSQAKYSKTFLILWSFILVIWTIANIIMNITLNIVYVVNSVCHYNLNTIYLISIAINDVIACTLYTYLFIKPIFVLNKFLKELKGEDDKIRNNQKLKHTAIKQFVLTVIAMLSTSFALIFAGLFGFVQQFAAVDIVISTFCVVAMYKYYQRFREKLFSICCCMCLILVKEIETDVKNLDITMTNGSKNAGNLTMQSIPSNSVGK